MKVLQMQFLDISAKVDQNSGVRGGEWGEEGEAEMRLRYVIP